MYFEPLEQAEARPCLELRMKVSETYYYLHNTYGLVYLPSVSFLFLITDNLDWQFRVCVQPQIMSGLSSNSGSTSTCLWRAFGPLLRYLSSFVIHAFIYLITR